MDRRQNEAIPGEYPIRLPYTDHMLSLGNSTLATAHYKYAIPGSDSAEPPSHKSSGKITLGGEAEHEIREAALLAKKVRVCQYSGQGEYSSTSGGKNPFLITPLDWY